ncbi:MAG: carboxylesterase family protein [Thermodesulfobacteriota bacterium]
MGGNGVWQLAIHSPGRFAAVAPVCGYGFAIPRFLGKVCLLKDIPIWVFHGAKDFIAPVAESQKLVDILRGCGGKVSFTIYPNCGHDSWTRTYKNPKIYRWFLSHSLPGPD